MENNYQQEKQSEKQSGKQVPSFSGGASFDAWFQKASQEYQEDIEFLVDEFGRSCKKTA